MNAASSPSTRSARESSSALCMARVASRFPDISSSPSASRNTDMTSEAGIGATASIDASCRKSNPSDPTSFMLRRNVLAMLVSCPMGRMPIRSLANSSSSSVGFARAFTKSMNGVGLIDARIAAPATSTASA